MRNSDEVKVSLQSIPESIKHYRTWTDGEGDNARIYSYSADDLAASAALPYQIASAVTRLAVVVATIFHVEPITGAGPVAEGLFAIDGNVLIGAS